MFKYVFILCLIATPAVAIEPLTSNSLMAQCSSENQTDLQACRSWVQGFVGGAFASRTAKQRGADQKETFSERAARTRIGRGSDQFGQNYAAAYCIPRETTLEDLVARLLAHSSSLKEQPEYANQLMLGMLSKQYPCAN